MRADCRYRIMFPRADSHCSGGSAFLFALSCRIYHSRLASYDKEKDGENNKNDTDRQCHETKKKENKGEDKKSTRFVLILFNF